MFYTVICIYVNTRYNLNGYNQFRFHLNHLQGLVLTRH